MIAYIYICKQSLTYYYQAMRRDVFQAIADPTRRDIINLIAVNPLNLNSIADNFDVSRPAISQHIKILIECGLINIKKKGRERYCEVQAEPLNQVTNWIEQFHKLWSERFDRLDDILKKMEQKPTDK